MIGLLGCGLRGVLPTGPVATVQVEAAPTVYTSAPLVSFPVLPLQVFALHYDLDLVVGTHHPRWDLHEIARIDLPEGPLWLAKDADRQGRQFVGANLENAQQWVPEIPVAKRTEPVVIHDSSQGRQVDVTVAYTTIDGDPVTMAFRGRTAKRPPNKRNGNTMGHSKYDVAAVLDLKQQRKAKAEVSIAGEKQRIRRILGLVPFRFFIEQTQAGFARGAFQQQATDGGFMLTRPGQPPEAWTVSGESVQFDNGITRLTYHHEKGGLSRATVHQRGRQDPILVAHFSPPLPDVRRQWQGTAQSAFQLDVGESISHGTGIISLHWVADQLEWNLQPTAPRWLEDRPMTGRIAYDGATVTVEAAMQ